jgi:small-conductance mechanosensitive channel
VRRAEKLLLQAATHPRILKSPPPQVQLMEIAKDTFDFRLLFYAEELMQIETIKSDVRFDVVRLFRENGVNMKVERA